jgi:hypothetical protein
MIAYQSESDMTAKPDGVCLADYVRHIVPDIPISTRWLRRRPIVPPLRRRSRAQELSNAVGRHFLFRSNEFP